MGEKKVIHTTGRNNCGGRCIIRAHVEEGKIVKITTECEEEANGHVPLRACIRGINYVETYFSENRLKYPLRRVGERGEGKFERISWEEAIEQLTREWIRIRDTYGPQSRYVNYATGVDGVISGRTFAKRLLCLDGGYLDYYNSYSTACIGPATKMMYGTMESGHDPKDWLNAKLILLHGHNPAETKFDSPTMYYLKKAKEKGIPIIVIDPRKNDTVLALNARWIPIRPTTDAALFDAMAYVILKNGWEDRGFLDRCCIGFDSEHMPENSDKRCNVTDHLLGTYDHIPKTPEWAEKITGVPADTIEELAALYALSSPAALIQGYGAQRHYHGEQSARGAILLACMTGNVGVSGGWASGDGDHTAHTYPKLSSGKNPLEMEIPSYLWTEAVLRGEELTETDGVRGAKNGSAIKMILNLGGNCLVNQHGDINRTIRILKDTSLCECIVTSDLFLTSSALYSDLVLPGISQFECENMTVPWKYGDFIGYTNQVVEPLGEGRFEYDWLCEVAKRLGLEEKFSEGRTANEWLAFLYEECRKEEKELPPFEEFKEKGIYRFPEKEFHPAFELECKDPNRYPFPTKSGKIELYSEEAANGIYPDVVSVIPGYLPAREGVSDPLRKIYPLQLIGWHTKRRCHSIHDKNETLRKTDPQHLWMNPSDAKKRKLSEQDLVLIENARGKIKVPVHITDRIMEGVCALSQGAWYEPDAKGIDLGGNINVLASHHCSPLSKGNTQHTMLVEVRKA